VATRKPKREDGAQDQARALVDLPDLGVMSGRLLVADAATVAALVASGKADTHPDAVAYAKTLADSE